jgi:hypothetical protein
MYVVHPILGESVSSIPTCRTEFMAEDSEFLGSGLNKDD